MPPLPPVANVVKMRLIGTIQGSPWNNILHLQYSGLAPTVADAQSVGTQAANAWNTNIAQLCPTTTILTEVVVTDLTSSSASQGSVAVTHPGTRVGTGFTAQVAMVSSETVNMRWRGGHPRIYVPAGVTTDTTDGRHWTTTFQTAATAQMGTFAGALNAILHGTTTYRLIAVRYFSNHVLLATPIPLTVNNLIVHGRIDTQRRRLGKETP